METANITARKDVELQIQTAIEQYRFAELDYARLESIFRPMTPGSKLLGDAKEVRIAQQLDEFCAERGLKWFPIPVGRRIESIRFCKLVGR